MSRHNDDQSLIGSLKKAWDARRPSGILCHKYKFIYYPVAKAGNSSMRIMIAEIEGLVVPGRPLRAPFEWARIEELKNYPDYKRIVIVRNPWSRLYACYKNKIYWQHKSEGEIVRRTKVHTGFRRYNQFLRRNLFHPDMTFGEFARIVAKIPDAISDRHFRSQYRAFCERGGPSLADCVVRLENFQAEMQAFLSSVGADDVEIKHLNGSRKAETADPFDQELVDIIARRYRHDIELLGYSEP